MSGIDNPASTPAWLDHAEYPFTRRTAEIDGHRIHYVDHGDGPVLLMLHGNPTWSFVWRGAISRLSDRFRCIAPDLPGFGLSEAPAGFDGRSQSIARVVDGLVRRLDLRDVVLVAQDWGGPIGLRVVAAMPERFSGLALGNTWAWPVTGDPHFERFAALMGGRMGAWLIRHANLFVNVMIPAGHRRRRLTRDEMRHYRKALPTPRRRAASAVLPREIVRSAPFLAKVRDALPSMHDVPALLVWADRDIAFRKQEQQRWLTELPHAELVTLTGAGHFLQSDAPEEFADAVADWHHRRVSRRVS